MNSHHHTAAGSRIFHACLALLLFVLASCASHSTATRSSRSNTNLQGSNTLSQVTIRTGGDSVAISGTTVDGRHVKAKGRTTRQAVDNLGLAAGNGR